MGKSVHDDVLDAAFKVIKSNATYITVCTSQPTTYAQATNAVGASPAGYRLAMTNASAITSADFAIANGSSGGRKITIAAQNSVSISFTGAAQSAQHVAVVDGTRVLLVTTCTKQSLTNGNKVNIPAFTDTIGDPT